MAVKLRTINDHLDDQKVVKPGGAAISGAINNPSAQLVKQVTDYVAKQNQPGGGAGGGAPAGGNGTISGISSSVNDRINSQFAPSQAYLDAMNYTNGLLQQLSSGRTSYTDQVKGMLDKIQSRDPFAYDVDTDTLFQQYLASQTNAGKGAMQDTMGQAAALTGGYGSSYATTAGNQAYNAYIRGAYDNLPQYYQLARDAYDREGDEMYRQFGLLSDADQKEYQRLYDAYTANFNNAQTQYGNEFSAWNADVSNAFNLAQMQNSDYWQRYSAAQSAASKAQSQRNADREYELEMLKLQAQQQGKSVEQVIDELPYTEEEKAALFQGGLSEWNNGGYDSLYSYWGIQPERYGGLQDEFNEWMFGDHGAAQFDKPLEQRRITMNKDGSYRDSYGNTYTLKDLKKALGGNWEKAVKALKAGESIDLSTITKK